ncbi:IS110 family transposase [Brevibacillus borstelensis]|uniref:IS110 family transposase n=1 Tax=Brevibacillus borstelensis TaxID=45462 RepID=UPI0030C057BB
MFYLGIDISKRSHEACLIDSTGKPVGKTLKFTNSQAGGQKLLQRLSTHVSSSEGVLIGMEATGHYWLALHSFLRKQGYTIDILNPIQSDAIRNLYIRQTKTDSKDAFLIAELVCIGRYTKTKIAEEGIVGLRQLTRFRFSLVDSISDLKRQVISVLDTIFPEYEQLFSDIFGRASSELLMTFTTPEELLNVGTEELAKLLAKHSKNRLGRPKAERIQEAARQSFGADLAIDAYSFQLQMIMQQIRFMEEQLKRLEEEIAERLSEFDHHLLTIPGIGPVLAASILAEIGDITRFQTPKQLAAFAGLDPAVRQSGQFTGTTNHISKRGSVYLRRALWLGANSVRLYDPVFKSFYDDKISRGKHGKTALGAVSRKLSAVIFAILRDNQPYAPELATK